MTNTTPPPSVSLADGVQTPPTGPATMVVTAGRAQSGGAIAPGLAPTTTYELGSLADARKLATSIRPTEFYQRYGNPTVASFEEAVADLEGADAARAFSSGMAAISATVLALCSSGSHIVASRQLYGGTRQFLELACPRFGIDVNFVDGTVPGALAGAVEPGRTTLVITETPANPRLDLVDLAEVGGIVGPFTLVDSTFATPLGQRPLEFGVDLVVHSASKAIAGHNDALLGVVAGDRDLVDWITGFGHLHGGCAAPADALNGLRGIRTLAVRLGHQAGSAAQIARWLEADERATNVRYPGLETHPQHELAGRQMRTFGGLVCFDVPAGLDGATAFVDAVRLVRHAPSLGGPETLLCHPASTSHVGVDPDDLDADGIGAGTLRISLGLEDPADVIADLDRALAAAAEVGTRSPVAVA